MIMTREYFTYFFRMLQNNCSVLVSNVTFHSPVIFKQVGWGSLSSFLITLLPLCNETWAPRSEEWAHSILLHIYPPIKWTVLKSISFQLILHWNDDNFLYIPLCTSPFAHKKFWTLQPFSTKTERGRRPKEEL